MGCGGVRELLVVVHPLEIGGVSGRVCVGWSVSGSVVQALPACSCVCACVYVCVCVFVYARV